MNKFASATLIAASLVAATPALAQTDPFSFSADQAWNRGDVWRLAQLNLRAITRNFDLGPAETVSPPRIDPFFSFGHDVEREEVEPHIVCVADLVCYESYGRFVPR